MYSRPLVFRHNNRKHIKQPSNPVHHPFTSTFYHFSRHLTFTCGFSVFELSHSHLNLSSSNRLSSEVITSLNPIKATHVSTLYRSSKYSLQSLHTSSSPCANYRFPSFILLQLSTLPPFTLLTSFQNNFLFPFTSSFIFLTVQLLSFCFDIYTPLNLSLFFFVSFHTSFFCLFIASCQHLLPSNLLSTNYSFYFVILPQILWVLSPTFTESHTSLALSTFAHFTCSHMCLTLLSPFLSTLFPSRDLAYPSL